MKLINSGKNTLKKSAKLGLSIQRGNAGLTALHTAIQNAPKVPPVVKALTEEYKDYINLIIGLVAESTADSFSGSSIICKAARDVNTAATANLAIDITIFQDFLENMVTNVMTPKEVKTTD